MTPEERFACAVNSEGLTYALENYAKSHLFTNEKLREAVEQAQVWVSEVRSILEEEYSEYMEEM